MKALVLGYGSAGGRHARNLRDRGVHVSVADSDPGRIAAARSDGFREGTLADVELAVIASPNHLHANQLAVALEAGCHVLVEKPIAVETAGLDEILRAADERGNVVAVGCNLRFVTAIEALRELALGGELGRPVRIRAEFGYDLRRWRPGRDVLSTYSARADEGGGILLDAIHEFDYLYWIFGSVSRVSCFAGSRTSLGLDVEDVACTLLDFESGLIGEVALDYGSSVYRRGFELVAEGGSATWRWADSNVVVSRPGGEQDLVPVFPPETMYARLIDDMLEACATGREPRTTGRDGLAVLRIVEAARRSASSGAAVEVRV